jgi:hypothetical protein
MWEGGGVRCAHRESLALRALWVGCWKHAAHVEPAMPNVSVNGGGSLAAERRLCAAHSKDL